MKGSCYLWSAAEQQQHLLSSSAGHRQYLSSVRCLGSSISGGHCAIYTECSYACGACADADVAAHQGGRQGRLPAANMIH
jgi:hypothetical protein